MYIIICNTDFFLRFPNGGGKHCNFNKIARHRTRLKNMLSPNAPKTVEDVEAAFKLEATMTKYGHTKGQERHIFYSGAVKTRVINLMTNCTDRRFYVDGSFRVVPNGKYKQLLIIHWEHMNQVI